jgi:peptidoglycan/xylan/chitin deacetylase (PgdA/CDA1 family)
MQARPYRKTIFQAASAILLAVACCLAAVVVPPPAPASETTAPPSAGGGFPLAANMILNRSFFLSWEEFPEENFGRYEVFAGPTSAPLPDAPAAVFEEADHCYCFLRGLSPETGYTARVRLVPADGSPPRWSTSVRATTLRDGFPEGTPAGEIPIPTFMYHHVRPKALFPPGADPGGWYSTENFERDLAWMQSHGIHGVTTADILDGRLPENPVFLTFDDGYTDFLEYAVPLLVKYGFPAANAIVTQRTAGQSVWAVPEWPLDSLMTWPQIRECLRQGMEIGGHTQTHVNLYRTPEAIGQVRGSYDDLVAALGEAPLYFCYPWGLDGHDLIEVKNEVRAAGYRLATRTWPPLRANLAADRMFLPREFANEADTLDVFLRKGGFPETPPAEPETPLPEPAGTPQGLEES